tara:strand:- start:391 stop:591 length:201 start_codon:yes stop_codon:yes gene_type:complete
MIVNADIGDLVCFQIGATAEILGLVTEKHHTHDNAISYMIVAQVFPLHRYLVYERELNKVYKGNKT